MKVKQDAAFWRFINTLVDGDFGATRLKHVRAEPLTPGGRARVTLFESVDGGRPHPRFQVSIPPAVDPSPPQTLYRPPEQPPADADALRAHLLDRLRDGRDVIEARNLAPESAPEGSPRFWRNSVRAQRIARFFTEARRQVERWLADGDLPADERAAAHRALREAEADAYAGDIKFDDSDTDTYHSFGHDEPFVHYLERLLDSLPGEDAPGFLALPGEGMESIRRQRDQLRTHLDYLMRHKYAYEVIVETDIERTLGGFLIDRESRRIASEVPDRSSLVPRYELLRVDPDADHEYAGAWVYRDGDGGVRTQDHTEIEVNAGALRSTARDAAELTFRRAPNDPHLRRGLRFDWDDNGWVKDGPIEWVSWAGHCDIKAIMEQLGITLADDPSVTEYRSDSGETTTYDRGLLLEMIASVLELGSNYRRADGTGAVSRGIHRFGGARNDSRPDRLQFQGLGPGKSFRWPLSGRQEVFHVDALAWGDEPANMGTVFFRSLPDLEAVTFAPNPRFLKTVEGDYNLIDVSGALIEATVLVDRFDPDTGYPTQGRQRTVIDLRAEPEADGVDGAGSRRYFLGTHIDDVAERRMYRVYLDRDGDGDAIVALLDAYEYADGAWSAVPQPGDTVRIPLVSPLSCTLSRELKRDDPAVFQALIDVALRQAENICADTDMKAAVWNGVVTRLDVRKIGDNREARTQRWRVGITARFGDATLDYLVRRDEQGAPIDYCPAPDDDSRARWPDFLWQDFPDVGSKGYEGHDWIVNDTMVERGIVTMRTQRDVPGDFYVFDDHIKNVYELIYAGLAGYSHTIVHGNKRYGFKDPARWDEARDELDRRADALTFE